MLQMRCRTSVLQLPIPQVDTALPVHAQAVRYDPLCDADLVKQQTPWCGEITSAAGGDSWPDQVR